MRLWSLHPKYLDRMGLLAAWREGLLAQKVLQGRTRGYTRHPQLIRFRKAPDPLAAIGLFLACIIEEARRRGYQFDASKIAVPPDAPSASTGSVPSGFSGARASIPVTLGQVRYEWEFLGRKLARRAPELLRQHAALQEALPELNDVFVLVPGDIEEWEIKKHFD